MIDKNKSNCLTEDTPENPSGSYTYKKRTSFFAFIKSRANTFRGSLTIEASLVLPIFMFFVIAIISFLMIVSLQSDIQLSMEEASRSIGKTAYLMKEDEELTGINSLTMKTWLLKNGLKERVDRSKVIGGSSGLYTYLSSFDEENEICDMVVNYNYKIPFLPGSMGTIQFAQRSKTHVWTGRQLSKQKGGKDADSDSDKKTVYVTEHGTVYHLSKDCHYLDLSIRPVSINDVGNERNVNGGKYEACHCALHATSDTVYVTDYGTNYHSDLNCSGLKRTIREVDIEEVGEMHVCPKCGGEH